MWPTVERRWSGSLTVTGIKRDKESGILNDPNGWFENPRDLVTAIERIVYVSVESTRIIEGLPSQFTDDAER